jgi:hypothetical protein
LKNLFLGLLFVITLSGHEISPLSTRANGAQRAVALKLTSTEAEDIREAVFSYQFGHNGSSLQFSAKVFYLTVGDREDPTDALITRFKGHTPPVKKLSLWTWRSEAIDKASAGRWLIFTASTIKRLTRNKVIVDGGYYEGVLSSSGNIYTVERIRGKWVVTRDQMLWIS